MERRFPRAKRLAPSAAFRRRLTRPLRAGPDQRDHLLFGLTANGKALTVRQYQTRLDRTKTRIGYVDMTFSAPKSVSVAWAFAPTESERAIIRQAHRDAIESVMADVEYHIGRSARPGCKGGWEPGAILVSFDHYAARPTVAVVRDLPDGEKQTELYTLKDFGGRVPGDMQPIPTRPSSTPC